MGDGEFALSDGVVGDVLCVVDAAEKQVGLGIVGLRGENALETGERFSDAALLEKIIGLGGIGEKKASAEKQKKRERNADEHG